MYVSQMELVRDGYTVSTRAAAFGRVGNRYVMRDCRGHLIALPLTTAPDRLREVWEAFDRVAEAHAPMPSTLSGETVLLS